MRRVGTLVLCLSINASCTGPTASPPLHDPDVAANPTHAVAPLEIPRPDLQPPSLRPGWVYTFNIGEHTFSCGTATAADFNATPVKRAIGDIESLMEAAFRSALREWTSAYSIPAHVDPADWLAGVRVDNGFAHINFRRIGDALSWAGTSCGGGVLMTEVMRIAFQFPSIERVSLDYRGDCNQWYLFEGEQTCGGRPRSDYRRWGPIPTVRVTSLEELRQRDKVVAYLPGPQGGCGERSEFFSGSPVRMRPNDPAVLTAAVQGLLERWDVHVPAKRVSVALDDGLAIIDFQGLSRALSFASTACGSVVFAGSMLQTARQFDTVDEIQFRLQGSCERFSEWWQAGSTCYNLAVS